MGGTIRVTDERPLARPRAPPVRDSLGESPRRGGRIAGHHAPGRLSVMRLGFVTSYMFPHLGGIERIAENLFNGYVAQGVEVRWVSSRIPPSLAPREGARIRVPCVNVVENALGVPVPIWGVEGYREVDRLARWADALHVLECLYMTSALGVRAARRHAKPVVLTQNVGFIPYRRAALNWIEHAAYVTLGRSVLRSATHVVLATPTAEAYVATLCGGPLRHSSAFPIGIDTERFSPPTADERRAARAALGLPAGAPVILVAGRLVEKKGLPIVVEVSRERPAVQFLVVGDGPLAGVLREAPPNVHWRQTVPADEMVRCYAAADGVLLPSHGEGLPLVVQEAMACARPTVIASSEVYAAALLDEKVCLGAALAAPTMAAAVDRALGDEGRALGGPARAYAERHWSLRTMMGRYVALLERLVADRRAPAPVAS
jgi:glycosyltransferase involved in cell wall biosynthesis